jgi:hypothetical protein
MYEKSILDKRTAFPKGLVRIRITISTWKGEVSDPTPDQDLIKIGTRAAKPAKSSLR